MKGSCACGAVGYEIDSIDTPISHCHCNTCRKTHAAAYVSTAGVLREHFKWTQGLDALRAFESSPGKIRHFCSHCGSHLAAERNGSAAMIVRVATLDEEPGSRPKYHIWTEQDVAWLDGEDLPRYSQWQPDR
ncbi:GFA family protein [Pseudomonas synxantha]|uniref:GFA family protein n=1 Tax=Pseudomonas synxantha TaxID=47883 RepID=A0ABS0UM06_9PSED|nr:GFA family protein [Pseudomonas synxantha]MBI6565448.1 GFA family protein [Pseudomonas synxantha]MBI6584617.1 GFA family protein [Pseudomonas synxantha]MBI6647317.1 GFA family protein [Pseudomonas synxantha]